MSKSPSPDQGRAFPGGSHDTSTLDDVEQALDDVSAPNMDRAGRWLTLPQRVKALAKELVEKCHVGR